MGTKQRKLSTRVVVYCCILAAALSLVLGGLGYAIYYLKSMSSYRMYIESTLNIVDSMVDADDMRICIESGQTSEKYDQLQQQIDNIKQNTMVEYIYLIVPMDVNDISNVQYVSIAYTEEEYLYESEDVIDIGEPVQEDAFTEDMLQVFHDAMFGVGEISYVSNNAGFGNMLTGTKPVIDSGQNTVCLICVDYSMEEISSTLFDYIIGIIIGTAITALITLLVIISGINRTVVRPIQAMAVAAGDFVQQTHEIDDPSLLVYKNVEVHTNDEISTLSESIRNMMSDMIHFMQNLTKAAADKERISAELNVANQIQDSMIPKIYPAFPERQEFDVYGSILYAQHMGNIFYDYFFIDNTHFGFFIGDISHTGISAALMMVIARTIIKNYAKLGFGVDRVFAETNNQISSSNESAGMKITAFRGIVDLETGIMSYVNAGHSQPFLKRSGEKFKELPCKNGFALGSMANVPYWKQEIQLVQGDMLFMYTNGLTEAYDRKGDIFSKERLEKMLNIWIAREYDIQGIAHTAKQSVQEFMNGAEQERDIAMLMFRYLAV